MKLYIGQRVYSAEVNKIGTVKQLPPRTADGQVRILWDGEEYRAGYRPGSSPVLDGLRPTIWCGGRQNGRALSGETCLKKGNHVAHEV